MKYFITVGRLYFLKNDIFHFLVFFVIAHIATRTDREAGSGEPGEFVPTERLTLKDDTAVS